MKKIATLKNHHDEIALFSKRSWVLLSVFAVMVFILIARLFYLQVIQQDKYMTLSNNNLLTFLPIEPKRGLIYDRNGILLAENIPGYNLTVIPGQVKSIKHLIFRLKKIISLSDEDLHLFFRALHQHRRYEPIPLKFKLSDEEVARFYVHQYEFPGVQIQAQLIRKYPLGETFAHALGYVGRINASELRHLDPANYSATNFMGKAGIEKFYEATLHGKVGYQEVETDATGRIVRTFKIIPPQPGQDLYLSIDSGLQLAAEKAMGSLQGAVVVIQPQTGEILALVSRPSFDPNLFVTGISTTDYKALQDADGRPLYNRALRGTYPLASTIKPYMALEALDKGFTTPNFRVQDPGWFKLPDSEHVYKDWKKGGHGSVNVSEAIAESCDTYFYTLAVKMGIENIDDILTQFGFGHKTGIDADDELAGNVPSPDWKMAIHGKPWYRGDTVVAGIGQGYMLTTPLQMANGAAELALKGDHFKPHLLLAMKLPNAQMISQTPEALPKINLKEETWDIVQKAMENVIQNGTGYRFGKAPYTVAAKTGTAQVFSASAQHRDDFYQLDLPEKLRDNALFIGYAPVENPKIAVGILVEHSNQATEVARKIMDYALMNNGQAAGQKS